MPIRIRNLMTRRVHAVSADGTLHDAAQVLWENDLALVPVVDRAGLLVGVLTDRDLSLAAHDRGCALEEIPVAEVLSADPVTCGPDEEPALVLRAMEQHGVRRIPVTDPQGRLRGIVSFNDLVRGSLNGEPGGGDVQGAQLLRALPAIKAPRPRAGAVPVQD